jgi:hypothetical protein
MNLFQRIKQAFMGGPVFLFFIGLIFFGIGAGMTYYQIIFRQDALQVPGEVISLSESCDDDGCAYSPIVRFTTLKGETAFYHSTFGSSPPEYKVGETVAIFYKAENPEKAIIAGEGGILRFIFMGIGGVVILASLVFFASNLKNSYLIEE